MCRLARVAPGAGGARHWAEAGGGQHCSGTPLACRHLLAWPPVAVCSCAFPAHQAAGRHLVDTCSLCRTQPASAACCARWLRTRVSRGHWMSRRRQVRRVEGLFHAVGPEGHQGALDEQVVTGALSLTGCAGVLSPLIGLGWRVGQDAALRAGGSTWGTVCLFFHTPSCSSSTSHRPHRGAAGAVAQDTAHRGGCALPPAHAAGHPIAAPGACSAASVVTHVLLFSSISGVTTS